MAGSGNPKRNGVSKPGAGRSPVCPVCGQPIYISAPFAEFGLHTTEITPPKVDGGAPKTRVIGRGRVPLHVPCAELASSQLPPFLEMFFGRLRKAIDDGEVVLQKRDIPRIIRP